MLPCVDIYMGYCGADSTGICYLVCTKMILNPVVFNILKK